MPKSKKSAAATSKAPAKKSTATAAPPKKIAAAKSAPAKKVPAKAVPARKASAKKAAAAVKKAPPAPKAPPAKKAAAVPAKKAAPPAPLKPAVAVKKVQKRTAALDKFFEGQKKLLLEEREVYEHQATTLRAEADQLAQDRDPGDVQFDEESGQGDSMNVERERDLALSAQALASIDEIDRAIGKIVAGTYGICEKCDELIPRERLKALPFASLCVTCKSGGLSRR